MQVVPQGIESVNGSSVDMGCTSPLVDSDGVMVCESQSYLIDGCSPDIDTSTSDWASQLVTVRRNGGTPDIPFPHVLLTFGFDTAVSLTGIEIDLFNCPDWNIGIPSIIMYLNPDYNLAPTTNIYNLPFLWGNSLQSSCDSLSNVTFSGGSFQSGSYRTVYILVDLSHTSSIQWIHVGEVRFNYKNAAGNRESNCQSPFQGASMPVATASCLDSPTCLQPTPSSSSPSLEPQPSSSTSPVATSVGYSSQSGQYMISITSSSPIKLSSFHFSTSLSSTLTSCKCYDNTYNFLTLVREQARFLTN